MKGPGLVKVLLLTLVAFFSGGNGIAYTTLAQNPICVKLTSRLPEAPVLKPVTWDDIQHSQQVPMGENKFVIITNRELVKRKGGLVFSNFRQDKLHYLVVFKKNNKWIVSKRNSFKEAFYEVDNLKPALFYVHGYGNTFPGVVSDGDALNRFYDVSLIIFDWPSRNPEFFELKSFKLAKSNARQSVKAFSKIIKQFYDYQKLHWKNHSVKSTLLLHSLGNLILQKSIESGRLENFEDPVFNSVVLNAPAVFSNGHERWVKKINFGKNIYITSNHKDLSFLGLWWLTFKQHLGGKKQKGSLEDVVYVNFSEEAKSNHNYFLNPAVLQESRDLKFFYFSIFTNKVSLFDQKCLFARKKPDFYFE